MAAALTARAVLLPQAPSKPVQGQVSFTCRPTPRVIRQQRCSATRRVLTTAMSASERPQLLGAAGLAWTCSTAYKGPQLHALPQPASPLSQVLHGHHFQPCMTGTWQPWTRSSCLALTCPAPCPASELIDGKAIAEEIRRELKAEVEELQKKYGKVGLVPH